MENTKLMSSEDEHSRIMDLFLLKSATEWLEKQNWISSPYGGENYLEDVIFKIKLMSGKEWEKIFSHGGNVCDLQEFNEFMEMLKTIDPNIKNFCESALKSTSDRTK